MIPWKVSLSHQICPKWICICNAINYIQFCAFLCYAGRSDIFNEDKHTTNRCKCKHMWQNRVLGLRQLQELNIPNILGTGILQFIFEFRIIKR